MKARYTGFASKARRTRTASQTHSKRSGKGGALLNGLLMEGLVRRSLSHDRGGVDGEKLRNEIQQILFVGGACVQSHRDDLGVGGLPPLPDVVPALEVLPEDR